MFPLLLHTIRPKMNILILRRVKPHINVILMNNYVRCSKMEYGVHNFVRKSCNCSFISPMKTFESLRTYHKLSEASTNSLKKNCVSVHGKIDSELTTESCLLVNV
jgi:hypothetical protein